MALKRKTNSKGYDNHEDNGNGEDIAAFTKDPEMEKDFLELYFREVERQRYRRLSLTKDSWTKLETKFNEKWKVNFAHRIFRNRYDYLRKDYDAWVKIIRLSGYGFCAATNSVHLPPEKWKDIIQQNPRAVKFQNSSLKYPELMKGVFEKTLAKGSYAWSPSSSFPRATNDTENEDDHFGTEENVENIELNGSMNDDYFEGIRVTDDIGSTTYEVDINRTRQSKATPRSSSKKHQKGSCDETLENQLEGLVGILKQQIDKKKASK